MALGKEAQEQEGGYRCLWCAKCVFFLALRIIAFRSTLSKAWITTKHPSLRRLFRHHQTAVFFWQSTVYRIYIYICIICMQ